MKIERRNQNAIKMKEVKPGEVFSIIGDEKADNLYIMTDESYIVNLVDGILNFVEDDDCNNIYNYNSKVILMESAKIII